MNVLVPITENGQRKKITKRKAVVKHLVNQAASGNPKAIPVLLNEARQHEAASGAARGSEVLCRPEDDLVMASIVKRAREAEIATSETPLESKSDNGSANTSMPEDGGSA